ncbi:MAG: ABC transporter permease subunit [Dehalococcoidia bacterium]|nr:ABC transporter permease subunit [Dehalococcoidia bacterium]
MQSSPDLAAGNIYDLGYRRYQGARLGRRQAVLTIYLQSLRAAFGLGRRPAAKIVPVALVVLALFPAALRLGIAAATDQNIRIVEPANYYSYIQILLALFVAAQAPELVGRDLRNNTRPLYFSRAIRRSDYALAKLVALASAMLFMTALPQVVLYVGNAFAGSHVWPEMRDSAPDLPRIAVSAVALSLFMAAVSLAVAAQTSRRAFAAGGIIALFVFSGTVGGVLVEAGSALWNRLGILISLYDVMRGATFWIFATDPEPESQLGRADLPGPLYAALLAALASLALVLLLRRYMRFRP